jgi:ubiquinone/menaquinone biosynthesis C-methylase UbiE
MALYDTIGKNYVQTRRSDPRIAAKLIELLSFSQATTVIDIGAGTGSYANVLAANGYQVLAIEPSAMMRNQATHHQAIQWIEAFAEQIPLPDRSAEAAIIMLAFHHFSDYQQALREIYRVVGSGKIILFTYDPAVISSFWLTDYFPSFMSDVQSTFLPTPTLVSEIESISSLAVNILPFPLPKDLSDSFAAVGWARPELYLDLNIRSGISSFTKMTEIELDQGLSSLKDDLVTNAWDQKYGQLRQQAEYDAGYRFVYTTNQKLI